MLRRVSAALILTLVTVWPVYGQTVMPAPLPTFFNASGALCNACRLETYTAGTVTPLATYQDVLLATPHANPIVLSSVGKPPAPIYLTATSHKFILKTAAGATIWTADNIISVPSLVTGLTNISDITLQVDTDNNGSNFFRFLNGTGDEKAQLNELGNLQLDGTVEIAGATVGFAAETLIAWNGRTTITSPADGQLMFRNNAGTSFSRIQLGGISTSFPAIQRNATTIEFVLADNSAFAPIAFNGYGNNGRAVDAAILSPAQITANQNDYNPASLAQTRTLALSSDASRNITGLAAQTEGFRLLMVNTGTQNIVLTHADAASAATNRFACPGAANFTLNTFDSVELIYITNLWRVLGF